MREHKKSSLFWQKQGASTEQLTDINLLFILMLTKLKKLVNSEVFEYVSI